MLSHNSIQSTVQQQQTKSPAGEGSYAHPSTPPPDAIVVDNFSSPLYPVASFILRRNSTNKPPTTNLRPQSPTNHDEPTANSPVPPAKPLPHRRTLPHTTTNGKPTWAEVAKKSHPNPQHVPYSEGRGPSSKRRHRKRTTRR